MAQFDVHRDGDGLMLLNCQSDLISGVSTRLCVPLVAIDGFTPASRLNPRFEIEGVRMAMMTHLAGAVPVGALGVPVVSLADDHHRIIDALDFLLTGF